MLLQHWLLFATVAVTASATPGPAVLLVMTHSLQYGPKRALVTIIGNISGLFLLSALAVAGASSLLLHSPLAFALMKGVGALYLGYLGVKVWRRGIGLPSLGETAPGAKAAWQLYRDGVLLAATNPKALAFTTALFPQFIHGSEPLLPQFALLVSTFMTGSWLCLGSYALLAGRLRQRKGAARMAPWLARLVAVMFIAAGIGLLCQLVSA